MAVVAPAIPWVLASIGTATAIKSGLDQRRAAEAQEDLQEAQNLNMRKAAAQQYNDLIPAQRDVFEAAGEESIGAQAAHFQARGRVNALAGASGTHGGAVDSMLRDLRVTHGRNLRNIAHNRDVELDSIRARRKGIQVYEEKCLLYKYWSRSYS